MNAPDLTISPRELLELADEVDAAKLNLRNAVGSPTVSPEAEVDAAHRLSAAEQNYTSALLAGFYLPANQPGPPVGIATAPTASVATEPNVTVEGRGDPLGQPMPRHEDAAEAERAATQPKRRGRPPKAASALQGTPQTP